ncbi:MAG TPA: twitching motility protein PilT [Nitrosopumilaceae archaeon]|nr:twitching motility protein PilT [Nitrosopumilaceae archaeon]
MAWEYNKKKTSASNALQLIKDFKKINISGKSVDEALISHIKIHKGIIATIDYELKQRIKKSGGSVLSLANDRIVLES